MEGRHSTPPPGRRLDRLVNLDGRCLATSGDYATCFTPDHADHHIFDPHSGRSPDVFCSVSVAARTGLEADSLSTAIFVSGAKRGLELIRQTPGARSEEHT